MRPSRRDRENHIVFRLDHLFDLIRSPTSNAHAAAVAKHYLSDRASFNATAKHWAQAYAQAPAHKQKPVAGKVATDAELAGLSEAHVAAFTDMGFPRDKVVRRCVTCGTRSAEPVARGPDHLGTVMRDGRTENVCETGLTRLDFGVEEVELQGEQHEQHPRVDSESDGSISCGSEKSRLLMDVTGLGGVVQVTTSIGSR